MLDDFKPSLDSQRTEHESMVLKLSSYMGDTEHTPDDAHQPVADILDKIKVHIYSLQCLAARAVGGHCVTAHVT